jgi:hypothetical protein
VSAAILRGDLSIVRAHFGHGAVAPAMADVPQLFTGCLKHLVLLGGNIHLFRPKIFAKIWIHGVELVEIYAVS